MNMINLLSESIKCKSCAELLKKPVFLPCGHSICKRHEKNENRKVECIKCHESFDIPVNEFAPNRDLESLLESEINELDLGDEYNSALQKLTHFEYLLDQLNRIKSDPETRINSVLSDLRNKVDLRREELKDEIDKEALKMIEKIDEFEKECKSKSIKSDCELDRKLELWGNDLTTWKQSLNSFKKDLNKWMSTLDKSTSTMKDLQSEYLKFNDGLFLNRLNELKWPQLSVPRYFQTISVEVDKLSDYKDTEEYENLIEHKAKAVGVNWMLAVNIEQIDEGQQRNNVIKVKLLSDIRERADNYKVDFDLIFLDQLGMGKSNVKSQSYELRSDKYKDKNYFSHSIKLRDLMENHNLYNIEKDSCIVQAVIKRIEYL